MKPVDYLQSFQLLETGARMGLFPAFAYVLGAHVLHRMHTREVRQITLAPGDLNGVVLMDKYSRFMAGRVEDMIHEGLGMPVGDTRYHISANYIDALQKLHWGGILYSDILESRLDAPGAEDVHFTMLPELREGVHWTEKTPVCYRMPSHSVETAFEQVASQLLRDGTVTYEKVLFL